MFINIIFSFSYICKKGWVISHLGINAPINLLTHVKELFTLTIFWFTWEHLLETYNSSTFPEIIKRLKGKDNFYRSKYDYKIIIHRDLLWNLLMKCNDIIRQISHRNLKSEQQNRSSVCCKLVQGSRTLVNFGLAVRGKVSSVT